MACRLRPKCRVASVFPHSTGRGRQACWQSSACRNPLGSRRSRDGPTFLRRSTWLHRWACLARPSRARGVLRRHPWLAHDARQSSWIGNRPFGRPPGMRWSSRGGCHAPRRIGSAMDKNCSTGLCRWRLLCRGAVASRSGCRGLAYRCGLDHLWCAEAIPSWFWLPWILGSNSTLMV